MKEPKLTLEDQRKVFSDLKLKFEGSNFRITKQKDPKEGKSNYSSRNKFKKR